MADLPIDDSASVLEEGRFGFAAGIDVSGNFQHLPPKERRAAKERRRARQERWRKGREVRASWSEADHAAEETRLRAEIDAWAEGQRHAA